MSEKKKKPKHRRRSNILHSARVGLGFVLAVFVFGTFITILSSVIAYYFDIPFRGHQAIARIEQILKFDLLDSARNVVYFRGATVETGAKFQFSAPPEEILQWLEHPNLCFELLDNEYIDIDGWIYFSDWQYSDTITSVATGSCTSDWEITGHRGQSIFIDQTQPDYWIVYFAIWFM